MQPYRVQTSKQIGHKHCLGYRLLSLSLIYININLHITYDKLYETHLDAYSLAPIHRWFASTKLGVPLGVTMAKLTIDENATVCNKLLAHSKQLKALMPSKKEGGD